MFLYVDEQRCRGCGQCIAACPTGALQMADSVAQIAPELCTACERCVDVCPEGAILALSDPEEKQALLAPHERQTLPLDAAGAHASRDVVPRVAPWMAAALTFVGREVAPRLASALIAAWDRRSAARSASGAPLLKTGEGRPMGHRRRERHRGRA